MVWKKGIRSRRYLGSWRWTARLDRVARVKASVEEMKYLKEGGCEPCGYLREEHHLKRP